MMCSLEFGSVIWLRNLQGYAPLQVLLLSFNVRIDITKNGLVEQATNELDDFDYWVFIRS